MSAICFANVSKRYGDGTDVIQQLDLSIEEGELMVLVGPSGCAKSTTLRMIAGLESITSGDLLIGGIRANNLPPAERNISMVFQSYALFPNMSVRGNLSFGMRIRKQDAATIASEVDRIAKLLGLESLLERRPRELSGGQAQRVALGRAMIRRPRAFLFDEPLSNLDAELRVHMRSEISQMQKTLGTTTVYVTHDQVEAMTMGDRIAVMKQGRIMQIGTPMELYENPQNTFVAGFIGSPKMNLIEAGNGQFLGKPVLARSGAAGLVVGVRPEHIRFLDGGGKAADFKFNAKVCRLEDLGHEALVQVEVIDSAERLTLRAPGALRSGIGSDNTLVLAINRANLLLFDAATGDRIPGDSVQ